MWLVVQSETNAVEPVFHSHVGGCRGLAKTRDDRVRMSAFTIHVCEEDLAMMID